MAVECKESYAGIPVSCITRPSSIRESLHDVIIRHYNKETNDKDLLVDGRMDKRFSVVWRRRNGRENGNAD